MSKDKPFLDGRELISAPMDDIEQVEERILAYAATDGHDSQRSFLDFRWLQNNKETVYNIFRSPEKYENGIEWRGKLQALVKLVFSDSIGLQLPKRFFDPHSDMTLPQKEKERFLFLSEICKEISDPELQGLIICGIRDAINCERGLDKVLVANKYYPAFFLYFKENCREVNQSCSINTLVLYQRLDNVFESLGLLLLRARMAHEKYLTIIERILVNECCGKTPASFLLRRVVNDFQYLPDSFLLKHMSEEQLHHFRQAVYSNLQTYALDTLDWIMGARVPAKIGYPYAIAGGKESAHSIATQKKYDLDYRLLALSKYANDFTCQEMDLAMAGFVGKVIDGDFWNEISGECTSLLEDIASGRRSLIGSDDLYSLFEVELSYVAAAIASGAGLHNKTVKAIRRLRYTISRGDKIGLVLLDENRENEVFEVILPLDNPRQFVDALNAAV